MTNEELKKMAAALSQVAELEEAKKKKLDKVDKDELDGDHDDREDKDIDNDGDVDKSDEYLHNRRKAVSKAVKNEEVELDEVLDTPQAMDSYRKKAKASKEKAASSATAKMMRSKDKEYRAHPAAELKTMAKRTAGERMADRNAARKTYKAIRMGKYPGVKFANESVELDEAKDMSEMCCKGCGDKFGQPKSESCMYDAYNAEGKNWIKMENYKESVELEEGAKEKALKALMTKALGGKRAKPGYTSAIATNGDFVVKDGGSRIIGRIKAGDFTDPLKESVELDENYRTLATKGMGAEGRKDINVGRGVDFYEPKNGSKRQGTITKMSAAGYEVKDDDDGKTYKFKYYDPKKAKSLLGESATSLSRLKAISRIKKSGVVKSGSMSKDGETKTVKKENDEVEVNPKKKLSKKEAETDMPMEDVKWNVYERILEKREREQRYRDAAKADDLKDNDTLPGKGAKDMDKDMAVDKTTMGDKEQESHDTVAKAERAGPSTKARNNDNKAGDKKIVNPVKGMK